MLKAETDWINVIKTFFHDPPDKAIFIQQHEQRATQYTNTVFEQLGESVSGRGLKKATKTGDWAAVAAERQPTPNTGESHKRAVNPESDGYLSVYHPLSAEERKLGKCVLEEEEIKRIIKEIVADITTPREIFLALWRFLPQKLGEHKSLYLRLPAETRLPDHTIWNHCDIASAFAVAHSASKENAFLSFHIGPVQTFIESARSVRDLWSGSMILSYLTFRGMLPLIDKYGPTVIIYPSLRGNPLLDNWLKKVLPGKFEKLSQHIPAELRKAPCIPNRFLALVPYEEGDDEDANRCKKSALEAWKEIAGKVKEELTKIEPFNSTPGWDRYWDEQISNFFDVTVAVLPWKEYTDENIASLLTEGKGFATAFKDIALVRKLAELIPHEDRENENPSQAGSWEIKVELSARLIETQRAISHIPPPLNPKEDKIPHKCSLMGSYEQMGPAEFREAGEFWKKAWEENNNVKGVRLREGERFCAIALTKRFSAPSFFMEELGLDKNVFFPDTATVSASEWLEKAEINPAKIRKEHKNWNGQWLHWHKRDSDPTEPVPNEVWEQIQKAKKELGNPPIYYAILRMDADDMGKWLRGEKAPRLSEVYHPKIREYFEGLGEEAKEALQAKRPLSPALHASISEALTNFSLYVVPTTVEKHCGTLIYAGGDDVLALLPVSKVLDCALKLKQTFQGKQTANGGAEDGFYKTDDGRELLMMGPKATISAGIAIVHYKEDLRVALDYARKSEKKAKKSGKDILAIHSSRRSGEHTSALCPWDYAETVTGWINGFLNGASDRWAYHLLAEVPTLEVLPWDAVTSEAKRLFGRSEEATWKKLTGCEAKKEALDKFVDWLTEYKKKMEKRKEFLKKDELKVAENFATLCQIASFMARGREK